MKCLIIRTSSTKINIKTYNMQEIGLAKALIRKGNVCDIIYYANDGIYKEQIIEFDKNKTLKIYWLNGKSILNNAIYDKKKLIEICNNYDMIQTAEYDQYTSYYLIKNKIKPIVIYHGPYYSKFKKKYNVVNKLFDMLFLRKYLKMQPSIITKSLLAENYLKEKGFKHIKTIGVGIDKERFSIENKTNEEVKKLLEEIGNRKIVLYIGQLEDRRSIDFIIKTYSKVYKEDSNTVLLIIGKGKEEYTKMCFDLVKELGLEKNVIFKSSINQNYLTSIYKKSSIFVLPSKYEIYGMVLLEAMYFGIPVITTYNGGSSTLINDKENGYIIDELNEDRWCKQIIEVLHNNAKKLTDNAKTKMKDYTWDELSEKFIVEYKKAIDNKK